MTPPGRQRSPLLTLAGKWSSSSGTINGDRSPHSAGGQCGGGVVGPAGRSGGIRRRGQTPHRPAKGSSGTEGSHNLYRETPRQRRHTHHMELHHTTLISDTSHNTMWSVCMDIHNRVTVGHTIIQPVHPTTTGPHSTTITLH